MSYLSGLIGILVAIIMGFVLYVITDRYTYITNVIIYTIIRFIPILFLLKDITFAMAIGQLIQLVIIGIIVVGIAQYFREGFDYDTIVWYILIITIAQSITATIVSAIIGLF